MKVRCDITLRFDMVKDWADVSKIVELASDGGCHVRIGDDPGGNGWRRVEITMDDDWAERSLSSALHLTGMARGKSAAEILSAALAEQTSAE